MDRIANGDQTKQFGRILKIEKRPFGR